MEIKIGDLTVGEKAIVKTLEKGESAYRSKLMSMGLTKGTEVKLTKVAPLGDPVELEVRGYKLSLRKAEAEILILTRSE